MDKIAGEAAEKAAAEATARVTAEKNILRSREIIPRFWYKSLAIIFASP